MALVLDTGPLFASLNRRDDYYKSCRQLIEEASERVVIPSPVLPEVDYFITTRLHPGVRLALLHDIRIGAYEVEDLIAEDYERIEELCANYRDADIGFVDAAVFAVVERLNESKLATLDRAHFGLLRPRHTASLTLLP